MNSVLSSSTPAGAAGFGRAMAATQGTSNMNHITAYSPRELHEMMQGLTHAETVNLLWRIVKDCRAHRRVARSINDSEMRGYITRHYQARYAAALRGARCEIL